MSEIRTELDRIISQVEEGHSKATAKGATPQSSKTLANLLAAIDTIPEATAPTLQSKTVSPSTSAQTVKPDSGYDGLSQVTVNAMTTATQATPSISVDSAGKITASATQTAGYVAAGTKSATKQLTTQAAKTVTPSTSSQTAVASGVYTTGAVTVAAIPSSYVKPSATKAATTYTPTTSNQTIAAGTYCSGAQTIKGDANLVAGNIKSGVSIFGVAGNYEGSGGSSGGAVETCTVVIDSPDFGLSSIYACVYDGSKIATQYYGCDRQRAFTIENVVCGSIVLVDFYDRVLTGWADVTNGEFVYGSGSKYQYTMAFATASAGGSITNVYVYDED